jgi:hypothetical protein
MIDKISSLKYKYSSIDIYKALYFGPKYVQKYKYVRSIPTNGRPAFRSNS